MMIIDIENLSKLINGAPNQSMVIDKLLILDRLIKKTDVFEEVDSRRRKLMNPFIKYRLLFLYAFVLACFASHSVLSVGISLIILAVLFHFLNSYAYTHFPEHGHPYLSSIKKLIGDITALSLNVPEKQVETKLVRIENDLTLLIRAVDSNGSTLKEGLINIERLSFKLVVDEMTQIIG